VRSWSALSGPRRHEILRAVIAESLLSAVAFLTTRRAFRPDRSTPRGKRAATTPTAQRARTSPAGLRTLGTTTRTRKTSEAQHAAAKGG
jgi:hypothetical protein